MGLRLLLASLALFGVACAAASSCPSELEGSRVQNLAVGFNNTQCVYAGTLPIEKSRGSGAALFYTFWAAQSGRMDAPLVLWLQGGPGASSSLALLYEFGPYSLNDDFSFTPRPINWNHDFHLLFLDQPIGTGLSRLPKGTAPVHNETQVGDDADAFLRIFFQKYEAYTKGSFYVTGESYGGHYVPSVALRIYQGNQDPKQTVKIPIRGLAVGNGFNSPCDQIPLSPAMTYQMGLISEKEKAEIDLLTDTLRAACAAGDHLAAYANIGLVFEAILAASGQVNRYNIQLFHGYNYTTMVDFFNNVTRQEALHVPNPPVNFQEQNYEVFLAMTPDQMISMKPRYTTLLDEAGLDVMIYHGNLDPCFSTAGEEAWLHLLEWSGRDDFRKAKREFWKVSTGSGPPEMAGYLKHAKNLTYAVVLQAGHLAPQDQPIHMQDLITRFVYKQWS